MFGPVTFTAQHATASIEAGGDGLASGVGTALKACESTRELTPLAPGIWIRTTDPPVPGLKEHALLSPAREAIRAILLTIGS